jgi:alpha-amylase/alpha-mannosidase (GH57 family)
MLGIDQQSNLTGEKMGEGDPLRALCIHGHFYQPPREDPQTGLIPDEVGAAPFRNWNERIHSECYRPNAELGNFEQISFNVGPTLLNWMEAHDRVTYQRILAQDRSNVERFGVGNAMAQSYHHTILPLAHRLDKVTQVVWGIADFEHRFGRKPEGMWLPETAVDLETLEILAEQDIQFTMLAPWQADVEELDPAQPYEVKLPSGRRMAVFFYHGGLSGGVSFDQEMTANAHSFALNEVVGQYNRNGRSQEPQILVIASDGELYGHHQSFRDWFLAYLVNGAGAKVGIHLTYPALWLKHHPPTQVMRIREKTSWSCHHGVIRWAGDCGCIGETGHWKKYLRWAFDCLAEHLDQVFAEAMQTYGLHPWELRNEYIQVWLGNTSLKAVVDNQGPTVVDVISSTDLSKIDLLLQAQFNRQRMYTSCGFFFEDFERLEPRNNLAYAVHAIHLTQQATGVDLSAGFRKDLRRVASTRTHLRGDQVFDRLIKRMLIKDQ